jgi:hypothetical protein
MHTHDDEFSLLALRGPKKRKKGAKVLHKNRNMKEGKRYGHELRRVTAVEGKNEFTIFIYHLGTRVCVCLV